jgi:NAD(P)-dependent dehydrogenase (short-subunit alcohol dehydrogenase family)
MNLQDKTVLLTGASGGIGQALARLLASKEPDSYWSDGTSRQWHC